MSFRLIVSMKLLHTSVARTWIVLRRCMCAYMLAIDLGFVTTPRVLHVCACNSLVIVRLLVLDRSDGVCVCLCVFMFVYVCECVYVCACV